MFKIKQLTDEATAHKISDFLKGPNAFEHQWAPTEKNFVEQAPLDSLTNPHHHYLYIEDQGQIIAAMGIRENKYGSGGYEVDADYLAVHKAYRRQGLASALLQQIEAYVRREGGRYIHVTSCDLPYYAPARAFYEKSGYRQVGEMPNYYVVSEGRVDYFKELD